MIRLSSACRPPNIVCDTSFDALGNPVIDCDTIFIDTITTSSVYGTIDTILRVLDDDFVNSTFYRVADSSDDGFGGSWVYDTQDSMFNIFWNAPSDSTIERRFVFWVRSRDDAKVPDLTPSYQAFRSINAKHERDLLVVIMAKAAMRGGPTRNVQRAYWDSVVNLWIQTRPDAAEIVWNTGIDFTNVDFLDRDTATLGSFMMRLLSHKVCVLLSDGAESSNWRDAATSNPGAKASAVFTAMQTGVNVWVAMRVPVGSFGVSSLASTVTPSLTYRYFFGVEQVAYSGFIAESMWPRVRRVDDFNAALSLNPTLWSDIHIDTARLHGLYEWLWTVSPPDSVGYRFQWDSTLAALPEVNWQIRTFDTEVQYLYGSIYGNEEHVHGYEFTFAGRPVAHRLNRGLFRSAHWLFTPMPFVQEEVLPVVFNMLDWLYDGRLVFDASSGAAIVNTEGVANPMTVQQARDRFWKAYDGAQGDTEEFYRLYLQ